MIDLNDYRLAWQVYLSIGILALVVWFFIVRGINILWLRYWLNFAAAAFLLTPDRHPSAPDLWVPASASATLSWVTEGLEVALPTLVALGAAQLLAIFLTLIVMNWPSMKKSTTSRSGDVKRPQVRKRSINPI
jgi:hypothetical protein